MDIAARIKITRGKLSQDEFSERVNVHKSSLGRYERGESMPDSDFLSRVCFEFGITPEWLLLGTGSMRLEKGSFSLVDLTQPQNTPDLVWIPMVEAVLSAGSGSLETSEYSEKSYAFRQDFITRKGNPKNMVLMRVAGNSMEPEIFHNDTVLIDQSKTMIHPGYIFAIGFEESIYLKRIDNLPGKIILKSANPAYPPVELDVRGQQEESFRIIGRVLWCAREYR